MGKRSKGLNKTSKSWVAVGVLTASLGGVIPLKTQANELLTTIRENYLKDDKVKVEVEQAEKLEDEFTGKWVSRTVDQVKAEMARQASLDLGVYVVQHGDTLSVISEATGISVEELIRSNGLKERDLVKYIEEKDSAGNNYFEVNKTFDYESEKEKALENINRQREEEAKNNKVEFKALELKDIQEETDYDVYEGVDRYIEAGDLLICVLDGGQQAPQLNDRVSVNTINHTQQVMGDIEHSVPSITQQPSESIRTYIVSRGDTLSRIARMNKVSVDQLKEWNNLESDVILVGQVLNVVAPIKPTRPEQPVTPTEPTTPVAPENPVTPTEPETTVAPENPTQPENPVTPTEPETTVAPENPTTPTNPTNPTQPENPTTPSTPVDKLSGLKAGDSVVVAIENGKEIRWTVERFRNSGELTLEEAKAQGIKTNQRNVIIGKDENGDNVAWSTNVSKSDVEKFNNGSLINRQLLADNFLKLINGLRKSNGLNEVGLSSEMGTLAGIRSTEDAQNGSNRYWVDGKPVAHVRNDEGKDNNTVAEESGLGVTGYFSENLGTLNFVQGDFDAVHEDTLAEQFFTMWTDSAAHKENMLNPNTKYIGFDVKATNKRRTDENSYTLRTGGIMGTLLMGGDNFYNSKEVKQNEEGQWELVGDLQPSEDATAPSEESTAPESNAPESTESSTAPEVEESTES